MHRTALQATRALAPLLFVAALAWTLHEPRADEHEPTQPPPASETSPSEGLPSETLPDEPPWTLRFGQTLRGGLTITGNTLGLSKAVGVPLPGPIGSIGAFISLDPEQRANTFPPGTTLDWRENGSEAVLIVPDDSDVLYAELLWGGSTRYGIQDVTAHLDSPVTFLTPAGSITVSPDPLTAREGSRPEAENFYIRTADVTAAVRTSGSGRYAVSGVPATVDPAEDNFNTAGWTLLVVYANDNAPLRNLNIFTGAVYTAPDQDEPTPVEGFCTSPEGPVGGLLLATAMEGDADLDGAQLLFGQDEASLTPLQGPNNPVDNFFASQINRDDGTLDTLGSFADRNHPVGDAADAARQGWDITGIDVGTLLRNNQQTALIRGVTSQDRYVLTMLGLQIDVAAPTFDRGNDATAAPEDPRAGDTVTFTTILDNYAGTVAALDVIFTHPLDNTLSLVPGSVTVDGAPFPDADPTTGFVVPDVRPGEERVVTFQATLDTLPTTGPTEIVHNARWDYAWIECADVPPVDDVHFASPTTLLLPRAAFAFRGSSDTDVLPGQRVTTGLRVRNTGATPLDQLRVRLSLPDEIVTYVPGSARATGSLSLPETDGRPNLLDGDLLRSRDDDPGTLSVGTFADQVLDFTVAQDLPAGTPITVTISLDGGDSRPAVSPVTLSRTFTTTTCDLRPDLCPPEDPCLDDPESCEAVCGNGAIEGDEECDDGNTEDGDGCSSDCRIEDGWTCSGAPSVCTRIPDGTTDPGTDTTPGVDDDPGPDDDASSRGCGCAANPATPAPTAPLALLLLGILALRDPRRTPGDDPVGSRKSPTGSRCSR
ncbi:MAG: DUF4215 domain-containing protein [Deltaproteobacteria bacterium]|nr:MAG: DUF4215 domain-containing protein [Deltaproteobacteria bacterium]